MAAQRLSTGSVLHLSDMRIVLLGNREARKSSAGNTILGREEFDPNVRTLQCVKRQGEVAGRQVTVVDTPGWTDYDHIFLIDSCNLIKQEIVHSVTLCPPGPHAVLFVIHENILFRDEEKIATSNHLLLLGHEVWKHSLVLFIQETPAEEKAFEVKGKLLQWLLERCGNRYHVLNIKKRDDTQVAELLEKIDKMVIANRGHFEIHKNILQKWDRMITKTREAMQTKAQVQKNRDGLRSLQKSQCPLDISIVLLGCKGSGKSSSGNTILDREEFQSGQRSAVCVRRQGEVAGRQITVVEAPGWWSYYSSKSSSEMNRKEIVLSQSLCGEGPHCFFVVLRADVCFTKEHRASVEAHVTLLSQRVWSHTMVLFTHGDWLGDTTIEQHIDSEGEGLQWLIEKCSNRYHVLNNHNKKDKDQVRELLEKIEEMVAGNAGGQFLVDRKRLHEVFDWKKAVDERAEERVIKMRKQKEHLWPSSGLKPLASLSIVLLGIKYHGRSAVGNTILGREEFELRRTVECVKRQGEVAGRQVTVVEAPGWWRNFLQDSVELIKQEIVLSVSLCPPGPHAVLLVICVDISFSETDRIVVKEHMELLGESVWNHTIVLFTYGDWLGDTTIEQYIESEGESLQWIVEKCGNRYHIFDNGKSDEGIQCAQLLEKIEEMMAGNEGCHLEVEKDILLEVERKRNHLRTRAEDREAKAYKQNAVFKYVMGYIQPLSEIRFMVLCYDENSTSAGGIQSGRDKSSEGVTLQCQVDQRYCGGQEVTTVTVEMFSSENTLEETKTEFVSCLTRCYPGPHAFVLKISTDLHFTEKHRRKFHTHLGLLGSRVWDYTIVWFQSPGNLSADRGIEKHIEAEGEALQGLVEKCGNRYINGSGGESWLDLLKKIEEMVVFNERNHFQYVEGKTHETTAADWKMEEQEPEEPTDEIDLANSMESRPSFGQDKRSDITSLSSAYHTHISDTKAPPSEQDSVMSAASSCGIGSLESGSPDG